MIEAMIYFLRVGCPWRDLPGVFGSWSSVYTRWRRWALSGIWSRMLSILARQAKGKLRAIDATFLKVHQHGANPAGGQAQHAIGRTKGGINTKLHAVVDGRGRALALVLTAGQAHELQAAPQLLARLRNVIIVGDKAYDSDGLAAQLRAQRCKVCIPSKVNRRHPLPFHRGWYRKRHHIENFFQRAKSQRRFATRYDKTLHCFLATVTLCSVLDWLR
jgi:transposase